jgi:hypothetical protein
MIKTIEDILKSYTTKTPPFVDLFVALCKQLDEKYKIVRMSYDSLHYKFPVLNSPLTWPPEGPIMKSQLETITLTPARLQLVVNSLLSEQTHAHALVEMIMEELESKLELIPVEYINYPESILLISDVHIRQAEDRCAYRISTSVGVGLSFSFYNKIITRCKHFCPKYIKCILQPQSCNLSWLLKGAK